jgi:hypothetical protein
VETRILNPAATYKLVFLSDLHNLDGSRDFVLRLSGLELKRLVEICKGQA